MTDDKNKIVALRKERDLSQAELAETLGVSQSTVSRLEKGEQRASLQIAAKLARVFEVPLGDLLDRDDLRVLSAEGSMGEQFVAFCVNPFCRRNEFDRRDDGTDFVNYKSVSSYSSEDWDRINFCPACGEDLVKACPECGRRIDGAGASYCISCGSAIHQRPTEKEKEKMTRILDVRKPVTPDDIPF